MWPFKKRAAPAPLDPEAVGELFVQLCNGRDPKTVQAETWAAAFIAVAMKLRESQQREAIAHQAYEALRKERDAYRSML